MRELARGGVRELARGVRELARGQRVGELVSEEVMESGREGCMSECERVSVRG